VKKAGSTAMARSQLLLILLAGVACAAGLAIMLKPRAHETVLDRNGILVTERFEVWGSGDVSNSKVSKVLEAFANSVGKTTKIGWLLVGNDRESLRFASYTSFGARGGTPLPVGKNGIRVAEVFSFSGRTTIRFRHDNHTEVILVQGNEDARQINVAGDKAKIVGFHERTFSRSAKGKSSDEARTTIWFYVQTTHLPTLAAAEEATRTLRSAVGSDIFVIFRTDSYFGFFDGPSVDVFDPEPRRMDVSTFYVTPYVVCGVQGRAHRCREELPWGFIGPFFYPEEGR
jgi:hypothetical protein